jgi:hypothetical protein
MSETKYRRVSGTVFQEVDRDILALNVQRGQCYGMEETAAEIWKMLDEPVTEHEICAHLQRIYDVQEDVCRNDVAELFQSFKAEGLIERVE